MVHPKRVGIARQAVLLPLMAFLSATLIVAAFSRFTFNSFFRLPGVVPHLPVQPFTPTRVFR